MEFETALRKASAAAGRECRKIARAAHDGGAPEEQYYSESEAMFRAVLYHWLRESMGESLAFNTLSVEPTVVYSFVDLVYCRDGLSWVRKDGHNNFLVQIKIVEKQKKKQKLYQASIDDINEDLKKLRKAERAVGGECRLILITAFIDYDSASEFDEKEFTEVVRTSLNMPEDIDLVVC